VHALDADPEAVRVAKANARANGLGIRFACADLRTRTRGSPGRFDVVCANLTADLLVAQRRSILRGLNPGGVLVLAGILRHQFPAVRRAYRAAGLRVIRQEIRGEWHSAAFAGKVNMSRSATR
jgi:ribosomal protein L11 methyltransferase